MTVDGSCNQKMARNCITNWMMGGFKKNQYGAMHDCVLKKAGCNNSWENLSPAQKEALAKKYETDVQTLGAAYKKVWAATFKELKAARAAHDKRQ